MDPADLKILKMSKKQRELKKTAGKVAKGGDKVALESLGQFLDDEGFLLRLDLAEDYEGSYVQLRLANVMKCLMNNQDPNARRVLLGLTNAAIYGSDSSRTMILIRALAEIRPAPPEAIAYWERYSTSEGPLLYNVIEALCINQSEPAMEMLEQKFVLLQIPNSLHKLAWMRSLILPRRNDEPLLLCSEKVVRSDLEKDLRVGLVEVLFDHQPDKWFIGCDNPKPPPRAAASEPAQQVLRQIGKYAIDRMKLEKELRITVKNVLKSLEA